MRGPTFIAIHELFDKVADLVEGYSDTIAELPASWCTQNFEMSGGQSEAPLNRSGHEFGEIIVIKKARVGRSTTTRSSVFAAAAIAAAFAAQPVAAQRLGGGMPSSMDVGRFPMAAPGWGCARSIPSMSLSAPASGPLQEQMQDDYATTLHDSQRELLQQNPSGNSPAELRSEVAQQLHPAALAMRQLRFEIAATWLPGAFLAPQVAGGELVLGRLGHRQTDRARPSARSRSKA